MKARNIKINTEVIGALNPCSDRFENWKVQYGADKFTVLEFLNLDQITARDKIWVAVRLLLRNIVETFAIDCALSATQYAEAAAAAYAAAYAAEAAAAAYAAEKENQVDALIYLIMHEDKL